MKLAWLTTLVCVLAWGSDTGVLRGRVTDGTGSPIPGAVVLAHRSGAGGIPDQYLRVEREGGFSKNLPAGFYDVVAMAAGFEPASMKVEVKAGQTSDFNPKLAVSKVELSEPETSSANSKDSGKLSVAEPAAGFPVVDSSGPPVEPDGICVLPEVLKHAGERAQELVANLSKFAATETMRHFDMEGPGRWGKPKTVSFEYAVEMNRLQNGTPSMEEYRDGGIPVHKFPSGLATMGLPVVAMVFHPFFADEFEMTCEGIGNRDGRRAYQIYFRTRPERVPRLRAMSRGNELFRLKLKGRAWLDLQTYQPVRIETDLMHPIPQLALMSEHVAVDYRPVRFAKNKSELWLQQTAEVFVDFRGRRFRRLHTFSDYMIFEVDVSEQHGKVPSTPE